jgi:hypothetical protein
VTTTATDPTDLARRQQVVLDQALTVASEAVELLEARARVHGGKPYPVVVALRGQLEEVRGRADTLGEQVGA